MIRIGTDIADIKRFYDMENLEAFSRRIFTKREREYFATLKNPIESIAGSFAAKEAFAKYLGSGFRGFGFLDVEVMHDGFGKPYIYFEGEPVDADVSISHSDTSAVAVVCGERGITSTDKEKKRFYSALLPKRRDDINKGDCGRVFVVAGSRGMVGAACLCSRAAMRAGSGLVTLGTPECVQPQAAIKLDEVMTMPLPDKDGALCVIAKEQIIETARRSDVCAIGPGLGVSEEIREIIKALLKEKTPLVIDADGLNVLAADISVFKEDSCSVVITPHPGEMARLTGLSIEEIEADREGVAAKFAKEYGLVVVLKGHRTVIASPSGEVHVNEAGNSGMASGGMGDVLTGVIASFIGQGVDCYEAAVLGVFVHSLSGDIMARATGRFGLIAGDVVKGVALAIKELVKEIE